MAETKASVTWQENKAFMGVAPSGHNVQIDADKEKGASPMELVLLGLGGCASYDVVSILQKSLRADCTAGGNYPSSIYRYPPTFCG